MYNLYRLKPCGDFLERSTFTNARAKSIKTNVSAGLSEFTPKKGRETRAQAETGLAPKSVRGAPFGTSTVSQSHAVYSDSNLKLTWKK